VRGLRRPPTVDPLQLGVVASELLQLGDYERLADVIQQAWPSDQRRAGEVTAELIESACRICEACSHQQAEAAWHREALGRIERRENELSRCLRTLIESMEREEKPAGLVDERPGTMYDSELRGVFASQHTTARGRANARSPVLAVHCLGPFHAYFNDRQVENWRNGKGKSIFKFLVTQRKRRVGKEILMELFWPGADPYAARNNLNVAIYGLRQGFAKISRSCSVVLFGDDCYLLNPELEIWVDYEAFTEHVAVARSLEGAGEPALAMHEYRRAEALYHGELFEEDRYEDWPDSLRRRLKDEYLMLLDRLSKHCLEDEDYAACAALCNKMIGDDACYEAPHRRLMRCFSRQGLPHLALRQYHVCRDGLAKQLDVEPGDETTELFERIRRREPV
jgi:DNA-binding SARP family transcriptional activator